MNLRRVIAVDHGNKNIKTLNHVFPAGCVESGHLLNMGADVLCYEGKEYVLSEQRKAQRTDKTRDDHYFLLTLFSIGKELSDESGDFDTVPVEDCVEIVLLSGLPPLHYKALKTEFAHYLKKNGEKIFFKFNSVQMCVRIVEVQVYPQAYPAAMVSQQQYPKSTIINIIDIGGYTVDLLRMINQRLDLAVCTSLHYGVNTLFQKINEQVRATGAKNMLDVTIEGIISNDAEISDCSPQRAELVRKNAQQFTHELLLKISEAGLDLEENQTIFVGGGSILLRKYIEKSGMVAKSVFVDNVKANVEGYQLFYRTQNAGKA